MTDTKPLLLLALLPVLAFAQSPAFEVASIKADDSGGNIIETAHGTLTARSATLTTCIMWAYEVQGSQISAASPALNGLLQSDRYTIVAKAAAPVPDSQLRVMLQALLAERFNLAFHRQSREIRVFALVADKSGPKFHPSQPDEESRQQASSKLVRKWTSSTMVQLANSLGEALQSPVQDETGLAGKYNFSLDLTPYVTPGERPDIAGMMATALHEQLGLKLEPRRAATDVLVIDRLEKPGAN